MTDDAEYNYAHFTAGPDEEHFAQFKERFHAGSPVPDFSALRLEDGATVRLSEYTAQATVVLEFGSYT